MSVALMFADRHLARYLTAAARMNEWQCTLSTCRRVWERTCMYIHIHETCTRTHMCHRPRIVRGRVVLHAAAPLALSYSTARIDTRHDSVDPPRNTPSSPRALRPPAGDTVCKQRKNATRLFSPAIRIAVGRRR